MNYFLVFLFGFVILTSPSMAITQDINSSSDHKDHKASSRHDVQHHHGYGKHLKFPQNRVPRMQ